LRYAKERKAFGKSLGDFGLIQQKLADMAARMFANESMAYRVTGHIEERGGDLLKAVEEFAVECSLVKIFGSETLGFVTDEAVQIHGGYGYHQDYAVERLYRDARIYRIFEGTNEINRLFAPSRLKKRAQIPETGGGLVLELLNLCDVSQQEQLAATTDAMMYFLALDSAERRAAQSGSPRAQDLVDVFRDFAVTQIESAARVVLLAHGREPVSLPRKAVNTIPIRRRIAERLLDVGKYTV
jgi:hypothetical protein